mmetsp:Transcript_7053/g.10109  ORF Transcript_7053/g.10109 Transcript_7053/m.10109 type:complete len:1322 (-) Transcript_7053:203-4168(-)
MPKRKIQGKKKNNGTSENGNRDLELFDHNTFSLSSKNLPSSGKKTKPNSRNVRRPLDRSSYHQPPSPCPEPPESLIKLLRKDQAVTEYFSSLQRNLNHDVMKWKKRALEYKSRLQLMKIKPADSNTPDTIYVKSSCKNGFVTQNVANKNVRSDAKKDNLNNTSSHFITKEKNPCEVHESRNDLIVVRRQEIGKLNDGDEFLEAFEEALKSISSSDDCEITNKVQTDTKSSSQHDPGSNKARSDKLIDPIIHRKDEQTRTHILKLLVQAFLCLENVGVWVVDQIEIKKIRTNEDEDAKDCFETSKIVESVNYGIHTLSNEDDPLLKGAQKLNDDKHMNAKNSFLPEFHCFDKHSCNINEENNEENCKETKISIIKRSDIDVITDLMKSLRSLVRAPLSILTSYEQSKVPKTLRKELQPFIALCDNSEFVPFFHKRSSLYCKLSSGTSQMDCVGKAMSADIELEKFEHPAVKGITGVFHSLAVIDTYCNALFKESNKTWDALFRNVNDEEIISMVELYQNNPNERERQSQNLLNSVRVGLKDRNISSMILSSLHGEVTRYWPSEDRDARSTSALEYIKYEDGDASRLELEKDDSLLLNQNEKNDVDDKIMNKELEFFNSKSQSRLFLLIERILHSNLLSFLFQLRSDLQKAACVVIDYIISTSPSPTFENCPRYPPVMSFCILEGLLLRHNNIQLSKCFNLPRQNNNKRLADSETSWFGAFLDKYNSKLTNEDNNESHAFFLCKALSLSVHIIASQWKEREHSSYARVRVISIVEVSAYKRLLISEKCWLSLEQSEVMGSDLDICAAKNLLLKLSKYIFQIIDSSTECPLYENEAFSDFISNFEFISLSLTLKLLIILSGDTDFIVQTCNQALSSLCTISKTHVKPIFLLLCIIKSCCEAYCHLEYLSLTSLCMNDVETYPIPTVNAGIYVVKVINLMINTLIEALKEKTHIFIWSILSMILHCCIASSDGDNAYYGTKLVLSQLTPLFDDGNHAKFLKKTVINGMKTVVKTSELLMVRVINLKRRPDRWKSLIVQARKQRILVILAVTTLWGEDNQSDDPQNNEERECCNRHAYDGSGSHVEFEGRMMKESEGALSISNFVTTHWRPCDLKAFDKAARGDDNPIKMSPSERACAMSHISSWIGVKSSLAIYSDFNNTTTKACDLSNCTEETKEILHRFKICGFASGRPILPENDHMDPTPVCIILEDDALLVDRFSERFNSLLAELPRDFHFCSLGYGRPKTAPIIKYSSQIGIPTCLWYLTGYILSFEGAKFLLKHLPVIGPVDSWIGLKMMANWDNSYGVKVGVGFSSKPFFRKRWSFTW